MLASCALIDSSIPAGSELLKRKTKDVRNVTALHHYFEKHMTIRDYVIVLGKYCQGWDAEKSEFKKLFDCSACQTVKMPGQIWDSLSKRKPLVPDPEPSSDGGWMSYEELVAQGETSGKYQPSLMKHKSKSSLKNRSKLMRDQCVRGFKACADCGRRRLLYSLKRLSTEEQLQLASAMQDVNFLCGNNPLPLQHPLRASENPVVTDDVLSCQATMEAAYYSDAKPSALSPPRADWNLVCFHCGSGSNVARDAEMVAQDKWLHVYPQCEPCGEQGVKVKHYLLEKQCAAARRRITFI